MALAEAWLLSSANTQALDSTGVRVVPTHEAEGLYRSLPGAGSDGCTVQYRKQGTSACSQSLNLWFDAAPRP